MTFYRIFKNFLSIGHHDIVEQQNGDYYFDQATKSLDSFGIVWSFSFSGNDRYLDAIEKFEIASECYKIEKKWLRAADCFKKIAQCFLQINKNLEASQAYINCSYCYEMIPNSKNHIVQYILIAVDLLKNLNKQCLCAKYYLEISKIYEKQQEYDMAITMLEHAIECYKSEGIYNISLMQKIAELNTKINKMSKSVSIYETLAINCLCSNLRKHLVKTFFLNSLLCLLSQKQRYEALTAMDKYKSLSNTFADSEECRFFTKIIELIYEMDFPSHTPQRTKQILSIEPETEGFTSDVSFETEKSNHEDHNDHQDGVYDNMSKLSNENVTSLESSQIFWQIITEFKGKVKFDDQKNYLLDKIQKVFFSDSKEIPNTFL